MNMHRCPGCNIEKPYDAVSFRRNRTMTSGLSSRCKECRAEEDRARRAGIAGKPIAPTSLKDDIHKQATIDITRHRDTKHKEAIRSIRVLEAKLEAFTMLKEAKSSLEIKPREDTGTSEATAVACFSDVHIGETVRPSQVNGLNEYSVDTCKRRCAQFFERLVRLTEKERQDVVIDELILFLGGDIIDGALHLDTIMSNEVAQPMNQAVIAQEIIEGGLRYLEANGGFKRITVVCKDGNHGRITHKLHHASRTGNALEWFIYYNLRARFPNLNWVIEEGLHTYVKVYDQTIRFHHGDTISGGGVAGFYTYLNRRRYQWNTARRADIDVLGHLHQYTATKRFVVNGSVVGYNSYAVSIGAEYERPMQAYFLLDKKRGLTVTIPILFD